MIALLLLKGSNKEIACLKQQMADKDALVKLYSENLNKGKTKLDKCKEENKKLKGEIKHVKAELYSAGDNAIDIAGKNALNAVDKFKKSRELQDFLLNTYGLGGFECG